MSPNTTTIIYAGFDISKNNLQLHLLGRFHDLPNSPQGCRRLVRLLAAHTGVQVICEATGGYERLVVGALHKAAIAVSVMNPARVRHFARARGQRAKTDQIDAAMLTYCGEALRPKPSAPRSCCQEQLTELVRRRVQLVEMLVVQRQQLTGLKLPLLRRQAKSLIRHLEQSLEQLQEQMAQ